MNYKILFFLFILFPAFMYSQKDFKNIYYYDEDGKLMTQSEFFTLNSSYEYISNSYEKDSDLFKILIKRRRDGTLTADEYIRLKNEFPKIFWQPYKFYIIEYITANPKTLLDHGKINGYVYKNHFINKINSQKDVSLQYISDQNNFPKILKFQNKKRTFLRDNDDAFKNFFYPFEILYHNFTVIRSDGKYISFLGEHGPDEVYKILKELRDN